MRFDTPVISGSLIIASSTTASFFNGRIDLYETASANFIRFKAPENVSASYVLTLPTASGQAGQAMIYDGSGSLYFGTVASSGGGSTTILTAGVSDVKVTGTGGGSAPSGSWQVRTLNTVDWDEIGLTVANNTITLPTGSYLIEASAPAYAVDEHQIRLFNSSSLSTLAYGSIEFASAVNGGSNRSVLQHSITVSGSIDIQLHHKVATSNLTPEGFGISDTGSFLNSTEIFSYLRIIKYQPALVYSNAYNTYSRTCRIIDLKASGSGGGAAVTGSWINRDLNTKSWDDIGVTLDTGSGIFTIPSGSYLLSISSPAHAVDEHQIRLYNTSSNSVEGYGTVEFAASTTGGTTRSHIFVKVNNIASQSFAVQHRVGTSNTSVEALGTNTYDVLSDSEIFTTVDIVKYAHPALEPVAVLNDLLDVDTTGPVDDNYILSYDSASSAYKSISPTTARGFLSHWTSSVSGIHRSGKVIVGNPSADAGVNSFNSGLILDSSKITMYDSNEGYPYDGWDVAANGNSLTFTRWYHTAPAGPFVDGLRLGMAGLSIDDTGWDSAKSLVLPISGSKIGVGVGSPVKALEVNGDALINSLTVGRGAGDVTTNTVVGNQALRINTTGYFNTAIGFEALYNNTTGINNIANGYASLRSNTTGRQNVATGNRTLYSITTAIGNTAIGDNVLYSLTSTSYTYNTAIGYNALSQLVTGTNNIAIGSDVANYTAGIVYNTSALNSIFIGNNTKPNAVGETNQIVIGDNAEGAGSNSVVLGNDGIDKTILKGNVGIGTPSPSAKLDILDASSAKMKISNSATNYTEFRQIPTQLRINEISQTGISSIDVNPIASDGSGQQYFRLFRESNSTGNTYLAIYKGDNTTTVNALIGGNGVDTYFAANNGNVGIGTTSPNSQLSLGKSNNINIDFQLTGLHGSQSSARIYNAYDAVSWGQNRLTFAVNNGTGVPIDVMSIKNGNVGIGTTNPSAKLEISSSLFSTKMLYAKSSLGYNIFEVEEGGLGAGNMFLRNSSGNTTIQLASGGNVYFNTGGNVGIGITNPQGIFHIGGAAPKIYTEYNPSFRHYESGWGANADRIYLQKAWTSLLGDYTYFGVTGNQSNTSSPTMIMSRNLGILFGNGSDSGDQLSLENMRITSSGNVGIGTTSPSHPIHLASGAHCTAAGTWTNASDIAYKYNIENLGYGLEDVMKLKPREFDMLADNSHAIGFVAQELEEVIPEIVSGEDGYKGVGYGPLVAVLVKAIQQQQSMLDVQQSLLDAQLKMIENLQEKVMMNTSIIEEMFNNG